MWIFVSFVFLAGAQPKPVFLHNGSFQGALKLQCDYHAEQKNKQTKTPNKTF